jgi:signal transduction histidine kinase
VGFIAFGLHRIFALILPETAAFIIALSVGVWLANVLGSWLEQRLNFLPQGLIARQAAFAAAQRETRIEQLERAFHGLLKGWGQSDRALIISGNRERLSGDGIALEGTDQVVEALKQLRWTTPERLARERATPERDALARFLTEHDLGVLVIAEGPSFVTLIGVGIPASRRPYTYPQVTQLMELASIMESALERAYFAAKVQHTEQLATVGLLGASLAHEIRNPLVTIKTFVQLLPRHYQDGAFRDKFFKLIGDEVTRIDQLTEQLLDLASPRTYQPTMIELHAILHASLDLVSAKAAHKNVQFLTEFSATPDFAFTDASAAKQVMLNLCFNAIQAVEAHEGERWVKIGTRNTNVGIEMAVADSGPGISPEIRPKLFQPFQTTKSTGFGLGLAICSDILANLNASISVDPPEPGHGATFRVIFPCQPLSS